jgi:hypothetical protein
MCTELKYLILKSKEISEDAHLIWEFLYDIGHTKWDEVESDDEDEPVEICSTTSTTSTDHQASTLKQGEDQRSEDFVPLQGSVRPVTHNGQTGASRGTPTCLMAKKEKKSKRTGRPRELRAKRLKHEALRQENLNFLNPSSHPWFVSMNHWLTNMIVISNLFI